MNIKAIIIPGNGGSNPTDKWFPYIVRELNKLGIEVRNEQFPDAILARGKYWLPFIKKLGADEHTILIGHSSGAVAAMRFAENHEVLGSVLVSTYFTDLGEENEKLSGYFDKPWNWESIRRNQKWIIQFASDNDPHIPRDETLVVRKNLSTEYYEISGGGHLGSTDNKLEFPEMVEAIKNKI